MSGFIPEDGLKGLEGLGYLVSIIIPTFNRAHLLPETLNSILNQELQLWECLVIDDGSSDHTQNIVQKYVDKDPRFKYFKRPQSLQKGAPSCRNFGFEMSSGDYIQWFDSDDIMLPNMLQRKVDVLQGNPDTDFVVAKMGEFSDSGEERFPDYSLWSENLINDYLLYKIFFLTPGPLFKRTFLLSQIVLFDVTLLKHQEWEFFSRLLLNGGKFVAINEFLCIRRMHDESIKSQTAKLEIKFRIKNKLEAVLALNRNTNLHFAERLYKLFHRKAMAAILMSFKNLDIKYISYFSSVLFKLLTAKHRSS